MKAPLRALIEQGIAHLRTTGTLPADADTPDFVVERPKDRGHGDFASNAAMVLAKVARSNPRALAQQLVEALPASDDIAKVEIAGPGFINFHLSPAAYQREVGKVIAAGHHYGRNGSGQGVCAGSGVTSCVDGQLEDSCLTGEGAGFDVTCDGHDDDCDVGRLRD